MTIKPFQAVYPNLDYVASSDAFFGTVKYDYSEYMKSGFFHKFPKEGLYIYQIEQNGKKYTGIIGGASIQDFYDGKIKKHENTLAIKEQQQIHLLISRGATVKPVLLIYPGVSEIDQFLKDYISKNDVFFSTVFEAENSKHSFWQICGKDDIEKVQDLFERKISVTYIADGHHRTTTAALMHERAEQKKAPNDFDKLLSVFFSVDQLDVHDYNRVIEGYNDLSLTRLIVALSGIFEIEIQETPEKPKAKHELTMVIGKEFFKLRWKKEILEKHKGNGPLLDASLLDDLVLKNVLGIKDSRTDDRMKYVEGTKGLKGIKKAMKGNEELIAFALYPVAVEELMEIADNGKTMPPKSTWFEPRIKNGLIVLEF